MYVKKKHPGGSSHGYSWPRGGEWVETSDEHAAELCAIQPGEFEAQPELPPRAKVHVPKAGPDEGDGQGDGDPKE